MEYNYLINFYLINIIIYCKIIFLIINYVRRILLIILIAVAFFFFRKLILSSISYVYENYSLDGLIGEIIGGLTTSVIIFTFYIVLMPIVEISPKIIFCEDKYQLKIYNSSLFAAYEVRAQLTKVTPIKANNGKKNVEVNDIKTSLSYIEYLPSMYNMASRNNGNTFAVVYTVQDDEDINSILSDKKDSSFYRLTVSCKNGFTGLRKIKTENYTYKSSLVQEKEFASGATFRRI